MARSEARLSVSIWAPESDFTELTFGAQWMYMFLLSQKDLAHTGAIALRERRWSRAASGMTADIIATHLAELESARYVVVDPDTEELLVRSLIRRDKVYRQPKVLRAAADQLSLIESLELRAALAAELSRVAELEMPKQSQEIIAEMLAALSRPDETPDEKGIGKGTENPTTYPSTVQEGIDGNPTPSPPGVRGIVTVVTTDAPSPNPQAPDPVPRSPFPGTTPVASLPSSSSRADKPRATTRATRIPDDFGISAEMRRWAHDEIHGFDIDREHKRFRDYWRAKSGKDATKLDWIATWRNWMRRAAESPNTRASPGSTVAIRDGPKPSTTDQRVNAGLALAAKYAQEDDNHDPG